MSQKKDTLNNLFKSIKKFGEINYYSYKFKECPNNINKNREYIITGENKNILTKTGTDGYWMGTICENELDKSIEEHKWKIKILASYNKSIMVGVAIMLCGINIKINRCMVFLLL